MAATESPLVTPLEDVTALEGFEPDDFATFEIPGFASRMPVVRERIKPKLTVLGRALAPRLSEIVEETLYPHVAQHLRRTVNPPEETWVAFARATRAYKPFVHLRAAISAEKVRVVVFVEDYADDKDLFAANLERNADDLEVYLKHHPMILAYEIPGANGEPKRGHELDAETLRAFAQRMRRVKGQHAVFGLVFARTHPIVASGPELADAIVEAAHILKPLYDCGKSEDYGYTYVPVTDVSFPPRA